MQPVRAQGDGTLGPVKHRYRRKDGTLVEATYWRAAVTVDGKRVYRSAKTKAEGKALLAELLRQRDARTVDGSRLRLRTYLEGWLDDVRPNLAPATWRKHEQHIRNHLVPAMGSRRLSELSVGDVRRYLQSASGDWHPQTLRHHRATLRRALADAVRDGLVTRNVAALAEPPKLDTKERPVLTAQEVRVLIDGTRDHPYGALFTLLATTGLREAEALALTWEDIDLGSTARPHLEAGEGLELGSGDHDVRVLPVPRPADRPPQVRVTRMTVDIWAVLFFGVLILGAVFLWTRLRLDEAPPIPRQNPRYIFRLVKREDRAAYVRIMRRTMAVQYRDLGRSIDRAAREMGKAFLPVVQRTADALNSILGK